MGQLVKSYETAALILLLLANVCLIHAHIRIDTQEVHQVDGDNPTFIRQAIESRPMESLQTSSRISQKPEFGDMFLPIRSAVETVPSINYKAEKELSSFSLRSFVRDSVEALPSDYMEISDEESQPETVSHSTYSQQPSTLSITRNHSPFLAQLKVEPNSPQVYRSDSPYQQLLQSNSVAIKSIKDIDGSATEDSDGAYGALAQIKKLSTSRTSNNSSHIFCYMTNWAFYRQSQSKFVPEILESNLCTTLIYSFAMLDPDHFVIKEFDPWVDIENDFYKRAVNSGIPVLIAIGGWTDSSGDKYSRLVSDDIKRRIFASNVALFVQKHGFSGLHFDWNYPVCWQSDCTKGPASDKPNLTKLLQQIRLEFNRLNKNLKLGLSISGYKEIINAAYDIPQISNIVDYITVMSYDYHGAWEGETGHVSPLYGSQGDKYPQYNTDYTMKLLLKLGAQREKLIMGIPFYGQTFTLEHEYMNLVREGVPSIGPGEPGEFTKQPGMLAYYEICQRIRKLKWISGRESNKKSGPFAMWRNQWVGYEDPTSVMEKARYAITNGLGGVAAWTIDLDDFQNRCCSESFPLLKSINREFGRIKTPTPMRANCERPSAPVTPAPPEMTTVSSDGSAGSSLGTPIIQNESPMPTTTSTTTTTTTTTPRTTTTKKPTRPNPGDQATIPPPAIHRPVSQNYVCEIGQYYPDKSNCNAYYQCISTTELRQQFCPGGLHWNRYARNCDWPLSAKCQVQPNATKPPSIKPISTQTEIPKPRPKPTKPMRCNEGEYYTHKSCEQFYICVNGKLVPNSCGGGLHWDAIRKICDWPQNVKCITTRQFLRIVKSTQSNPEDPCDGGERVAYPGDCSKYLYCLWNRFQVGSCASGLHFNRDSKNCDWPSNAQCNETQATIEENIKPIGSNSISNENPSTTTEKPYENKVPTEAPVLEPLSGHYKIVCYFTNWAWYRKGVARYTPDNINTDLCTHIVYGFAVLDYSELILKTHDSWADIDNNFYTRVSGLKKKGVKVSLALGGWNDSLGDKYSRLVRNPLARARFIKNAIQFMEKYGFEGLDLDWEYPVCWQTDCSKGVKDEKQHFTDFVRELAIAFKPKGLLLSAAVSPSKKIIDSAYDVQQLSEYFDWIAVMTYDFHGQWDKRTGHVAPLYYHPDDEFDYFNANYSLNYWIEKGANSRKIIMGMPLYGQSFTLENSYNNGLNAKAPGPGKAGEFTKAAGFLAYYEICDRIKNQGWKVVQDPAQRMGPYAYKGTQWVSFDDAHMISKKSQLVRDMNLGGAMIWALDLDDFQNRCGEGSHPLLRAIHNKLKDPPSSEIEHTELNSAAKPIEVQGEHYTEAISEISTPVNVTDDPKEEIEYISSSLEETLSEPYKQNFKVVCYFTNWAWYRQGSGKYLPEDIDADLCTHIVYGFAVLDRETLTIKPHDSWADLDNKFYERVVAYKAKGIKVLIALGGWNDSAGDKYSRLVRNPKSRAKFVQNVHKFIETYGFDGLDLDWEYPVCWQVDCKKGTPDEKEGFTALVRELSMAFKSKQYLLSSAVSPNKKVIDAGYDVKNLSKLLSWIAVMTYDYHGQWDKKTGHVAPMYHHPAGVPEFNANFTINYWLEQGAEKEKLVMGMPMYGQSFTLAQSKDHGLNAPTYGGGEAGEATRARGFLSYYEICDYIIHRGWNVVRDPLGRMGPYAYKRDQWVSFDDTNMIKHKSEYVRAMGLGGAMIWALDLDDFQNKCDCESYPLLKTINRVLRNYPAQQSHCKLEPMSHTMISGQPSENLNNAEEENCMTPNVNNQTLRICTEGQKYAAHEKDCNKYYICLNDRLTEQSCPNGLYWNEQFCDWPQNSKCSNKLPNTLIETYSLQAKPTISTHNKSESIDVSIPRTETEYKVICYFTNWAWYRAEEGKFLPEDIDENLCTHVVYSFAVLDGSTMSIKTQDYWTDIDNQFYKRVAALRAKGVHVLVALGGWNDSYGNKYARLVLSSSSRKAFVVSALDFVQKYHFDGLDLHWEYPVCWQVDCSKGSASEKAGFVSLVRELSDTFKKHNLLLSAAVSSSKKVIEMGYEVAELSKYLDWISVMTYDFHGHWEMKTGHVAPLFQIESDFNEYLNANFSINHWLTLGASSKKLIMGIPFYGQSFSLANAKEHNLNDVSVGPGRPGAYTKVSGFLAYYEICEQISQGGWSVERDSKNRLGPYSYKGDQWVSYDDVSDVRLKAQYIKNLGLGGGMVWALDLDDFRGRCGCGKYPLLRTLSQELLKIPGQRAENCT